jgi:Uma2 family endonuclease
MPVSERTFLQIALEEPNQWELHCGRLRRKPPMTYEHNDVGWELGGQLRDQLDGRQFRIRVQSGHVRRSPENYYIPDVFVIPIALTRSIRRTRRLEVYESPLPLVVEIWSPSTGDFDIDQKLPEYRRRGDLEIWRIHPFDHTLIIWRRQPDGTYTESHHSSGKIQLSGLPGVTIDFDALFVDEPDDAPDH